MVTPKSRVGRCLQSQRAGRLQSHLGTFGEVLRSLHSCWGVLPLPQYFYWQYLYQHIRGNKGGLTHCICLLALSATSPLSLPSSHLPGVSLWLYCDLALLHLRVAGGLVPSLLLICPSHSCPPPPSPLVLHQQPALSTCRSKFCPKPHLPLKIWNQGLEWGLSPLTLWFSWASR